jgi:hypothetical protein
LEFIQAVGITQVHCRVRGSFTVHLDIIQIYFMATGSFKQYLDA